MPKRYYLGLDQGTTGTMALLLDEAWNVAASGYAELTQIYPQSGWVEHNPVEIYESLLRATCAALQKAGAAAGDIACIGIDNQGETCLIWERDTGKPIYNAIVWQDRRTARQADALAQRHGEQIRQKTGLLPSSYFSATKLRWILDHVDGAMERAKRGELLAGTLDAWMIWKLTGGAVHRTDFSTASRTMLMDMGAGAWDEEILELVGIPRGILPEIHENAASYGNTDPQAFLGAAIPIFGSVTDQQAALFGQACLTPGSVKTTYGTGCFMLMNTGETPVRSEHGLLTTVGWKLRGRTTFALDGGIYIAGAAVQWLRDKLGIIQRASDVEALAREAGDNGGVYFVPAFVGLAAPHWDQYARGAIVGLTGGAGREHIARAALESIAYQVKDNMDIMERDSGMRIRSMRADGGMVSNSLLMQLQADILGVPVEVPEITETTALGAAYLAACGLGALEDLDAVARNWRAGACYEPRMSADQRESLLRRWRRAVERAMAWEDTDESAQTQ